MVLPTRLLLAPLEIIAEMLGRAFMAFNHHLPVIWQLLVFMSVILLLLVAMLFKCRYGVRMLGGFLNITPATPHRQNTPLCGLAQPTHIQDSSNNTELNRQEMNKKRSHQNLSLPTVKPNTGRDRGYPKKFVVGNAVRVYLGNVTNEQVRIRKKS